MIFTERTIRVSNGTSSISSPIILYKGDKNIKIRFKIVDCPYTYSKNVDNIIETSEASYAQLIIKTPNNGSPILSDITEPENGYVTFIITGEMIDEAKEVGKYSLQVRLLDDEQYGRITIPEVVDGIEVREPMVTEGVSTTNEVDVAVADYAVTTAAATEDAFNSEGNYIETNWQSGDVITSAKLNKTEKGIAGACSQIKEIANDIQNVGNPTDEQVQNAINTAIENGTLQGVSGTTISIGSATPTNGELYWYDTTGDTSDTPVPGEDEPITYTITNTLTNCTTNNSSASVTKNSSYTATITANDGYDLGVITVTMGGTNVTSSTVNGSVVTISSVTGDVVITCTAIETSGSTEPSIVLIPDAAVNTEDNMMANGGASAGYTRYTLEGVKSGDIIVVPCRNNNTNHVINDGTNDLTSTKSVKSQDSYSWYTYTYTMSQDYDTLYVSIYTDYLSDEAKLSKFTWTKVGA